MFASTPNSRDGANTWQVMTNRPCCSLARPNWCRRGTTVGTAPPSTQKWQFVLNATTGQATHAPSTADNQSSRECPQSNPDSQKITPQSLQALGCRDQHRVEQLELTCHPKQPRRQGNPLE